ncbi:hypothetical protein KR093_001575 [Drosophila rubida]|uniref:Uncharacterized protein n=1 Tax=Drosophila rubida TaxID=30044 RepID=A0AAD4JXX8_9MUSC|nr:hypothetical protein KR093_001575 [Drosophila rubida]
MYVFGKTKFIMESVQTYCDHDFVEYFRNVPGSAMLYTFRVAKLAPTFSISVIIRALTSQRLMYQMNNLDGCLFLNNPLISKALRHTYQAIVANKTVFRCPIEPKVYFLKNMARAKFINRLHPYGRYQVNVRIHMPLSPASFVMEVIWKYNVVHFK